MPAQACLRESITLCHLHRPHLGWEEGWIGEEMRGAINMYDERVAGGGSINNPGSQLRGDGDQPVEILAQLLHSCPLWTQCIYRLEYMQTEGSPVLQGPLPLYPQPASFW